MVLRELALAGARRSRARLAFTYRVPPSPAGGIPCMSPFHSSFWHSAQGARDAGTRRCAGRSRGGARRWTTPHDPRWPVTRSWIIRRQHIAMPPLSSRSSHSSTASEVFGRGGVGLGPSARGLRQSPQPHLPPPSTSPATAGIRHTLGQSGLRGCRSGRGRHLHIRTFKPATRTRCNANCAWRGASSEAGRAVDAAWGGCALGEPPGHLGGGRSAVVVGPHTLCRACPLLPVPIACGVNKERWDARRPHERTARHTDAPVQFTTSPQNLSTACLASCTLVTQQRRAPTAVSPLTAAVVGVYLSPLHPSPPIVLSSSQSAPSAVTHSSIVAARAGSVFRSAPSDAAIGAGHPPPRHGPPGASPRRGRGRGIPVGSALAARPLGRLAGRYGGRLTPRCYPQPAFRCLSAAGGRDARTRRWRRLRLDDSPQPW